MLALISAFLALTCCFAHLLAAPVYLADVALMVRSYARAGTVEGATRKLAIMSTQRAAGRSSEVAWTTWDGMQWDKKFRHVFCEVPQPKG